MSRKLEPILAVEVAFPEAEAYMRSFSDLVERSGPELEALKDGCKLVEPYWDERLKRDP